MITLSATLEAAAAARSRVPAISLVHQSRNRGIPQLDFAQWYDGTETDYPHAACITPAGTLLRVQNRAGTVYLSRVTNAASSSTYSSFSSMAGQAALSGGGIAIAAGPSRIVLAYVKAGGLRVTWRESTDDGATWTTGADVYSTNETVVAYVAVATAEDNNDDWMLFWNRGDTVLRRTGNATTPGSWAAVATHAISGTISGFSGIAATAYGTDWQLVIAGYLNTSNDRFAAAVQLSSGGSLGTFYHVALSDAASGITSYSSPSIVNFGGTSIVTYTENETNLVAYTRSYFAIGTPGAANVGYFTEPQPLDAVTVFGAQLAAYPGESVWCYTTSDGVWGALYDDTETELGPYMLSLKASIAQDRATLTAVLTDVASPFVFPNGAPIAGGTLQLQAGYRTSDGLEYGSTWTFEISAAIWHLKNGRIELTLVAFGPWDRAALTRSRDAISVDGASGSRGDWFARALVRAGGIVVADAPSPHAPGADWTTDHSPDLFARPGEPWADVAARFLAVAPEGLYFDGNTVYVRAVSTADTADVAFNADVGIAVPVLDMVLEDRAPALNWARVSSADRYADRYDSPSGTVIGPRLRHIYEPDADSNTKAAETASGAVARARWARRRGVLTAPWHPGLQLLDVVEITNAFMGLSATDYRVLALALEYSRAGKDARYNAIVELGAL